MMRLAGASPFAGSDRPTLAGRTILQIIPRLDAGGAERTTIDIAAALAARGARALVACEGGRLVSELQAKGGDWLPFPAASKNPFAMALNIRKLERMIRSEGVDLVHARSRAPAWVALGAVRRSRTPFVTTWHGAYGGSSTFKKLYNSIMGRGDVVIANSNYTAGLIADALPFAAERTRVIYRGTDFRQFAPESIDPARVQKLRRQWQVAPEDRIVLVAARLTRWKGHRIVVEATKLLQSRGISGIRVVFAGDAQGRDSFVRELDDFIAEQNLGDIVSRVGHCADMPAALLAASVVAVPSIEPEAFGRSAVEAQAMGVPVVVTDLGAAPETVLTPPRVGPGQRTGWCVPPGDAVAMADALQEALGLGASARDGLAQRARAHVTTSFSLEQMCRQTLEVYLDVLAGREAGIEGR